MKRLPGFVVMILYAVMPLSAQNENGGKISGTAYMDYLYNVVRDGNRSLLSNTALAGDQDYNAFLFRRIYFTYDYVFSEKFDSRFRIEADENSFSSNKKFSPFIKDAYLRWNNIFSGSDLIFGMQPTLAFEISEFIWGYRSLEKTIMDLRGIVSSRDLAVSLKGNINQSGSIQYGLMIGNNSGTGIETNKYKRIYGSLGFYPAKNFQITAYGDLGFNPEKMSPLDSSVSVANNVITTAIFFGYSEKGIFSAGLEGFLRSSENEIASISGPNVVFTTQNGIGISLFGRVNLSEKIELIGRYDFIDPNSDSDFEGDRRNYIIGGISFSPEKNINIIPNILVESYENMPGGKSFKSSVTARITFAYNYK